MNESRYHVESWSNLRQCWIISSTFGNPHSATLFARELSKRWKVRVREWLYNGEVVVRWEL